MSSVLLIGDPRLRARAEEVADVRDASFIDDAATLHAALREFRAAQGFGRAIAAPQIGMARRFIAMQLEASPAPHRSLLYADGTHGGERYHGGPVTLINPEIVWRSEDTFTLWDDCMSFPFLLVRVRRHASICVRFADPSGATRVWDELDAATSELCQHEIDHLDGVLAIDRAVDVHSVVARDLFVQRRAFFERQVDRYYDERRVLVVGAGGL